MQGLQKWGSGGTSFPGPILGGPEEPNNSRAMCFVKLINKLVTTQLASK